MYILSLLNCVYKENDIKQYVNLATSTNKMDIFNEGDERLRRFQHHNSNKSKGKLKFDYVLALSKGDKV